MRATICWRWTAFVAKQSREVAISTGDDPQLAPFVAKGRELFMQRQGQLNLSCANCHDDNWDKKLAGSAITQAHPTGYPIYRLEWQTLGSLERRLRSCISGIRAQAYDYGAPELVELELYLMSRARGMTMESRRCGREDGPLKRPDAARWKAYSAGAASGISACGT